MKKLLIICISLSMPLVITAQRNTTAKGALDEVVKSFGTFDTTAAFNLLTGDMAKSLPNKIRRDAKDDTPAEFNKKVEDTRVMFLTIKVINTYATDTLTAFEVQHKKHLTDDDANLKLGFMVFKNINGLWYLELLAKKADGVVLAYPIFQGKIPVGPKKEEIKQE